MSGFGRRLTVTPSMASPALLNPSWPVRLNSVPVEKQKQKRAKFNKILTSNIYICNTYRILVVLEVVLWKIVDLEG